MTSPRITLALLTHPLDDFAQGRSLVNLMIPRWEAMGIRVVIADPDHYVPADLAFLHVSLSVVPDAYRRLAERYARVVNGAALDMRKRRFSRQIVERDGPDPGMVIVKTDANSGGYRELRGRVLESAPGFLVRGPDRRETLCRWVANLESRRSWRRRRALPVDHYPVFASRDLVPAGVWRNPHLVVERFRADREGDQYCCRHWLFLGSREVHRRTLSPHPIVRFPCPMEPLPDPVPEELRAIRRERGFDYGKFDYGIVDGRVVLYDVNRTTGTADDPSVHNETIEILAPGIFDFVSSREAAQEGRVQGVARRSSEAY